MKRTLMILSMVGLVTTALAQPSWTKKAPKSVFTLKTFTSDGQLKGSATGFFTQADGVGVSSFEPFRGASRAVVIDAAGKEYAVVELLGANDTYDVARFRVEAKKVQPLPMVGQQPTGSTVWLLPYKGAGPRRGVVRKAETIQGDHSYYTVALTMPEGTLSAPLLNEEGQVVGLMQQPNRQGDSLSYAVDASFADGLRMVGLSINDPTLRSTFIKKALPDDIDQAVLQLYMGGSSLDSAAYVALVNDFIAKFPQSQEGYVYRAYTHVDAGQYAAADADMQQALKVAEKKDDAHFSYSRLIYQQLLRSQESPFEGWTLQRALDETREANAINAMPIYRQQEARVLYAMKDYAAAYDVYASLSQSNLRSADLFYEAASCQKQLGDTARYLSLLDSCVAQFSRPYLREAAPYLLARAEALHDAGRYRAAVNDYNDYEQLMRTSVNDRFYYIRHQAEVEGRLYQQALNDLDRAIAIDPNQVLYHAEKASLLIRVGMFDDAKTTSQDIIRLAPDDSDGYLFLGLAQCLSGQKKEGVANLRKAQDMGDPQAEGLIEKYSK